MMKTYPLLNKSDISQLHDSLHFLHVSELKEICTQLSFSTAEKKARIIKQILLFIQTGNTGFVKQIPSSSKRQKGMDYPLLPETKMVYGVYKIDARTRSFFKELIGPHFHYTVYGLDWIKERWLSGNPPTYKEFAEFWQKEYTTRKGQKGPLKQEWAYMNFIRNFSEKNPSSSRKELLLEWEKARKIEFQKVQKILEKITHFDQV